MSWAHSLHHGATPPPPDLHRAQRLGCLSHWVSWRGGSCHSHPYIHQLDGDNAGVRPVVKKPWLWRGETLFLFTLPHPGLSGLELRLSRQRHVSLSQAECDGDRSQGGHAILCYPVNVAETTLLPLSGLPTPVKLGPLLSVYRQETEDPELSFVALYL